ncbi:SDR family oxidoreductase [Leeuwenhoekiella marinoflava]|uniref:NAD(P)-dependent dehydrogenase (Short-subunit alcohol dehydrogenase family) n=2 Tax=Leeuwenhoekiella marinoflava TaxID=988 RepID=A0A4Q0PJJ9_9FLAO|nr:SDR family oxidoreductase [Leeuwenhoekiella marinoflava]RXG27632.1 NAD(P)-dependent dehydrogenase (short-subunit alcohol dehydrogenase family) [Leeuwenhoekiella marinoflava]SHF67556.1 NAD(P)-dependent dehydrogenase, short-chain alcohol dehydrogenase family [Leeuwenhoekiella marinoflava DSM 3653]
MKSLISVENKIIVISGATGVLGESMTRSLAKAGAHVVILGRTKTKVDNLVEALKQEGFQASGVLADVTSKETLIAAKSEIEDHLGYIDVLINAAGGNMPGALILPEQSLADADVEEMRKVMDLNYTGTFLPTQVFLPLLEKSKTGSVLNISSVAAHLPLTRVMGYASAKAAIENLTQFLAVEFAQKQENPIRVNALAPGFFLTEQNRDLLTNKDGSLTNRGEKIIDHTPLGKFGNPEDLSGAIHWLCSDSASFVTGTVVTVDGGFKAFAGV